MSIADLKVRLADVPGIHTLNMGLAGGRILLRWGEGLESYTAVVDAAASDGDIETAIRNAIKLPPVSILPDNPAPAPLPAVPNGDKPMSASTAAATGASIKQMLEDHARQMADAMEGHKATMRAGFDKQLQAVAAIGRVAAKANSDGDDFLALVGQFTNEI